MKLKLTQRNSILLIVILLLIPILYFSFTSNYISNQISKIFRKNIVISDSKKVEPFPSLNRTYSVDNKWSWSLFEGVIKKYGTKDGIEYAEVGYFLDSEEEFTTKIYLQSSIYNLPIQIQNLQTTKSQGYNEFRDSLVEKLSYYEKYADIADMTTKVNITLEDFKNIFPVDTSLVFRIIDNYPLNVDLDSDYCKENVGLFNCAVVLMNKKYAPDFLNLWKGEKLSENSIIVPNNIFISLEDLTK